MTKNPNDVVGLLTMLGVRLSFPSIFEMNKQTQDDGSVRETWKANALIDKALAESGELQAVYKGKRMPILKALKMASEEAKTEKWGSKDKWPKLRADKVFLRDGDEESWDGYEGCWYVSANARPEDRPAVLTNRGQKDQKTGKLHWIPAEPGGAASPYSGCYVNMIIQVWCQDNKHGKRVNAQLKCVQFVRDGEPFSAGRIDADEMLTEDMIGEEGEIGDDFADEDTDLSLV
jgi:Protein of unknown function (DUF2815)